jgi:hypothetical protein
MRDSFFNPLILFQVIPGRNPFRRLKRTPLLEKDQGARGQRER